MAYCLDTYMAENVKSAGEGERASECASAQSPGEAREGRPPVLMDPPAMLEGGHFFTNTSSHQESEHK